MSSKYVKWYILLRESILVGFSCLVMGCTTIKAHNQSARPLDDSLPNKYQEMNKRLWRKAVLVKFRKGTVQKCADLNVNATEITCYTLEGHLVHSWPTSEASQILKSRRSSGILLGGLTGVIVGNAIVYFRYKDPPTHSVSAGVPLALGLATVGGALFGSQLGNLITKGKFRVLYDLQEEGINQ